MRRSQNSVFLSFARICMRPWALVYTIVYEMYFILILLTHYVFIIFSSFVFRLCLDFFLFHLPHKIFDCRHPFFFIRVRMQKAICNHTNLMNQKSNESDFSTRSFDWFMDPNFNDHKFRFSGLDHFENERSQKNKWNAYNFQCILN